jgi:hypothetical protein
MKREQENFVSRRAVLPIAAGALASAAVIPAVADQSGELAALIAAHRAAGERFGNACQAEDEISDDYRKAHGEATAPCLLGDAVSLRLDREECIDFIAERFDAQRKHLERLARVAPEIAAQAAAALDAKEAENIALLDRAIEEEEARREAFGWSAAKREWRVACDADDGALVAVCAYVCRSPEEGRLKAEYLLRHLNDMAFEREEMEALLQSIAGGAANV